MVWFGESDELGGLMMAAALLSIGSILVALGAFRITREPRRLSTGWVLLAAALLLVA